MIRLVVLDIDGVVTSGHEDVVQQGAPRSKRIAYVDLDAIEEARREGFVLALLTAQDDAMVPAIAERLGIDSVFAGVQDKRDGLREIARAHACRLEEICFIGDSNRDGRVFESCGITFAPANATALARSQATFVLHRQGGDGAIAEAVEILLKLRRMAR